MARPKPVVWRGPYTHQWYSNVTPIKLLAFKTWQEAYAYALDYASEGREESGTGTD